MEDLPPLAVLAFLGELALLALLAVSGARLGDGGLGVALALAFPLLLAVVWGRWLAPRAARALPLRPRVVANCGVVLACAAVAALAGLPLLAGAALVVVGPVFVLAEVQGAAGHPTGPT